jgi:hypothetical protein
MIPLYIMSHHVSVDLRAPEYLEAIVQTGVGQHTFTKGFPNAPAQKILQSLM